MEICGLIMSMKEKLKSKDEYRLIISLLAKQYFWYEEDIAHDLAEIEQLESEIESGNVIGLLREQYEDEIRKKRDLVAVKQVAMEHIKKRIESCKKAIEEIEKQEKEAKRKLFKVVK